MEYKFIDFKADSPEAIELKNHVHHECEVLKQYIIRAFGEQNWNENLLNHQADFYVDYVINLALNSERCFNYSIDQLFDDKTFESIKKMVNDNPINFPLFAKQHFNNPTTALNHYVRCYRKLESEFNFSFD